jgi:hypothetical protein
VTCVEHVKEGHEDLDLPRLVHGFQVSDNVFFGQVCGAFGPPVEYGLRNPVLLIAEFKRDHLP